MSGEGKYQEEEEKDETTLPGFRFHPTDEELLGYYLRRKVENKPIKLELIKQIDIYKFDPWDLPRVSSVGEEWYFFCMRGRKYKNSVRPNRVTGSGFWKATGIDKPVYSKLDCVGLKKSLVYYLGSAGKGSKTDWMMHEFRLPSTTKSESSPQQAVSLVSLNFILPVIDLNGLMTKQPGFTQPKTVCIRLNLLSIFL
ncbi:hypothetical protein N665_2488s0007 [Sinapis alba]|nr:hypothetical protein N665_2488s0007 [Sinapis alba]